MEMEKVNGALIVSQNYGFTLTENTTNKLVFDWFILNRTQPLR